MPSYLYYQRGEEWVRVNADSFEREYLSNPSEYEGGQCPEIAYVIYFKNDIFDRRGRYVVQTSEKFISAPYGPITAVRINAERTRIQSFRYDEVSGSYSNPISSIRLTNLRDIRLEIHSGGSVDNCGNRPDYSSGDCNTIFKLNGTPVLTIDSCPEVTNGRGCSDCCRELLTIARNITI